ncbi:MAG: NAD(P)H-dependent oxidoreductase [Campylobacterota bacterium]|nr:NAD(P)H-dependent oxidoreductase [Campylobacterota bacterium]
MNNNFSKAIDFRHACKVFDTNKKIPNDHLNFILNMGRKSPSSFGMEPWKFLVIQDQSLKEKIKPFCWNQAQIDTCSDLIIILAKIDDVKPENRYVKDMFLRRDLPQDKLNGYLNLYAKHLKGTMSSTNNIFSWTSKQCYIALANMTTAAAFLEIDSCPIEGFEKENIETLLDIDTTLYQLSVILPLGYRINKQSKQLRLDFDDVVEFIK